MSVNLHLADSTGVDLKRAILLYEAPHGATAFATLHDINARVGDGPCIGPGRCLTRDALEETLQHLQKRPQVREILPGNVLRYGDSRLCWHVPASVRPIFFKTTDSKFNQALNGRNVLHPPLVFLAKPGFLSVWALSTNERPAGATTLHQAPYYNIYTHGGMCNGNTRLPDVPSIETIPAFERAFFETNFTHTNARQLFAKNGDHKKFWKEMKLAADRSETLFTAAEWLLPLKLTLQEALNQ